MTVLTCSYNTDSSAYHDLTLQPCIINKNNITFYIQLQEPQAEQTSIGVIFKYFVLGV